MIFISGWPARVQHAQPIPQGRQIRWPGAQNQPAAECPIV